jgi:hypothetical protein
MHRFHTVLVLWLTLAALPAAAADLQVVSHTPARHTMAPSTASITIHFDRALLTATITPASFRVFGRASGPASGPLTFSQDDRSVTLTPDHPFSAGETVLVNLASTITAVDGTRLRSAGYAYAFTVRTQPSSRVFEPIAQFSNRSEPGVQTRIYGALATDLNGDGSIDLATVNEVSGDLRVFLNRADGTGLFAPFLEPPHPIGFAASPNEPADFDNDGRVDICVSASGEDSVWIVLGRGDGRFASTQQVRVGAEPHGIAVLDVDGDADLDIVVASTFANNLALLINDGAGHFSAPAFFESGTHREYGLAAADLNNDGITDLVIGARGDEQVIVNLGNGDGTFTPSTAQSAGGSVWMVVTGDVNGDGFIDVTTANSFSGTGSILLGNGDGTLRPPQTVTVGNHVVATDLGDLDGDGDLDWVLSSFGSGRWRLLVNDGDGGFSFDQEFVAVANPSCAVLYDGDNDGDLDLTLTDEIADVVRVLRNGGPAALCPPAPFTCRQPSPGQARLQLRDRPANENDSLGWSWMGATTTKAELGDPLQSEAYALCIFDAGELVASVAAPAGGVCAGRPCWKERPYGYEFTDPQHTPDGARRLVLKQGSAGMARIRFDGRGAPLLLPSLGKLTGPIDVQLHQRSGGTCWGARFRRPFLRHDDTLLRAIAD